MAKHSNEELHKTASRVMEKPIRDEIVAMAKGQDGKSLDDGFTREFTDRLVDTYHEKSALKKADIDPELRHDLKQDHKQNLHETLNKSLANSMVSINAGFGDHSVDTLKSRSGALDFMQDQGGLKFEQVSSRLGTHNIPNSINNYCDCYANPSRRTEKLRRNWPHYQPVC